MHKVFFVAILIFGLSLSLSAQMSKEYVPYNDMPNIMQNYYADVTALNRVYIVLQQNSMPVEMLRNILTDQPLKEDYKTNWRFDKLPYVNMVTIFVRR